MENDGHNRYNGGWQHQGRRGGRGGNRGGKPNGFDRNRNFRNNENKGNQNGGFNNNGGWKRNDGSNFNSYQKNHFQQPEKKIDYFENMSLDDVYSSLNGSKHSWYDIGRVKIIPKTSMGQFKSSGFLH